MSELEAETESVITDVENEDATQAVATDPDVVAEVALDPDREEAPKAVEPEGEEETTDEEPDAEAEPEAKKPGKRSFKKRIDQLTKKIQDRDRFIDDMQQRFQADQAEAAQHGATESVEAPNRDTYDDYEAYVKDLAVHTARETIAAQRVSQKEAQSRNTQAQAQAQFESVKGAAIDAGNELYDDFEAVATSNDLALTPVMAEAILSSGNAPHVWYYLGKNPEESREIAHLPPMQQALAIGRLSNTVNVDIGKQTSDAPTPPKALKTRGSVKSGPKDKQSTAAWIASRNKQLYG